MKKILCFCTFLLLGLASGLQAQQADIAFGVSTVHSTSAVDTTGDHIPQSIGGGAYTSFSMDVLLTHGMGFGVNIASRASRNVYLGGEPFRPFFYDFDGVYAPKIPGVKSIVPELQAGIGVQNTHFYTPFGSCGAFGCTNYTSSNHFLGHVGGGVRLYVRGGIFIRPEFHAYFTHNNFEFSSATATRYGASLGYSFGH